MTRQPVPKPSQLPDAGNNSGVQAAVNLGNLGDIQQRHP